MVWERIALARGAIWGTANAKSQGLARARRHAQTTTDADDGEAAERRKTAERRATTAGATPAVGEPPSNALVTAQRDMPARTTRQSPMHVSFGKRTDQHALLSLSTNIGSKSLPFQTWHHFKETFATELVARAIEESELAVRRCCDPFAGSGASALACQLLGVHPITIEVNPFLADLMIAKLCSYDPDHLIYDTARITRRVQAQCEAREPPALPATFVEPGKDGRWLFDRHVAQRVFRYLGAIESLAEPSHRRLFRILLGGCLTQLGNVTSSGKGRRYRRSWRKRTVDASDVDQAFSTAAHGAIGEIGSYAQRLCTDYTATVGDCRAILPTQAKVELCVCFPPYPNSFDYTDIYNIELRMLGYLADCDDDAQLRKRTLYSHVQVGRPQPKAPAGSTILNDILGRLGNKSHRLWSHRSPDMVAGYFADMMHTLRGIAESLVAGGAAWLVVGNSRYAGISIPSTHILKELMPQTGLSVESIERCRAMRSGAQQGDQPTPSKDLLILRKP